MADSEKLTAALDAVRRGFAVFPIIHNGKSPAIANWQNLATTDEAQIRKWWGNTADYNIGTPTEGRLVIDIDPRKGGIDSFEALKLQHEFPKTLRTVTASGGAHVIYAREPHTSVRNSAGELGQGIDVRADGGLIVLPGSTIDDRRYTWGNDNAPTLAPQELVALCKARRPKSAAAGKRVVEEDEQALDLAWQWIENHAPQAELGNLKDTAYRVACHVYDFGLSEESCREYLSAWGASHCSHKLEHDTIVDTARHALQYRGNAVGSKHPDVHGFTPQPDFSPTENSLQADGLATAWAPVNLATLPKRQWVIPGVACRQNVGMLAGPAGVSKSTWMIATAVAIIAGRSDVCGVPMLKRCPVWLWNQEDDIDELQRRLAAVMQAFDVSAADLHDDQGRPMLYLNSGVDKPLMLANRTIERTIVRSRQVDGAIADIVAKGIGLAIFDPLVEFHQGEENDNVQMRTVLGIVREIAVKGNCATMLCAHTRKPDAASSRGFAGEMDSVRGASAQLGVVRSLLTLNTAAEKDAKSWRMEGSHLAYVRLDMAKNNLAPLWTEPKWFKRESVTLGASDGESVGVLRPIELKRIGKVGTRIDVLEAVARVMTAAGAVGRWVALNADTLGETGDAELPAKKNRERELAAAFDENTTHLTADYGALSRKKPAGEKRPYLYRLDKIPASSLPQTGVEEDLND